ncbi:MAG: trypsin-like peptidase domain-containing protein [Desulfobacterales bacterium]|nr:trypsin-like peptidase domain-containing protein [Desulfobacterales bacterium]
MKKLFLIIVLLLFVGCHVTTSLPEKPAATRGAIHTFKITSTTVYGIDKTSRATCFHIGDGYLVTAAHCVVYPRDWGSKIIKYVYTQDGEDIELIGITDDIALLYNNSLIGTPAIEWGDSDLLKEEDPLLLIGNSAMQGNNWKGGMVSKLEIDVPVLGNSERTAKASFITDTPINGGDSGSPVFILNQDRRRVVGMVYASHTRMQGYNLIFKSNYIRMVIKEIRNKSKCR